MKAEASSSKPLTFGPRITRPLRSTDSTASSMRSCSSAYCPLMSMSPTAMSYASLRAEEVEPGTYHRAPEGATGRARPGPDRPPGLVSRSRRCSPAQRPVRYAVAHGIHHRHPRPVGDRPHRRLGPAGRLLPDAARERLHPRAERGDHALRRLRRERGQHDPAQHHGRRRGRQRRRLLDRLLGRALRRTSVHRQVRQVRPAPPPPRGAGGALVRQVRGGHGLLHALPAHRAHLHLAAGRHRQDALLEVHALHAAGLHPVGLLPRLAGRAARRALGGDPAVPALRGLRGGRGARRDRRLGGAAGGARTAGAAGSPTSRSTGTRHESDGERRDERRGRRRRRRLPRPCPGHDRQHRPRLRLPRARARPVERDPVQPGGRRRRRDRRRTGPRRAAARREQPCGAGVPAAVRGGRHGLRRPACASTATSACR